MRPKIVFVDDEENILKAIKRDMIMADINAEYFSSAADALEHLRQNTAHIVISDFMMPEMNGVTFLKEIQGKYPDIYRAILSSCGREDAVIDTALKNRTIEQIFCKPWDVNNLLDYFERFKNYAQHSTV